MNIKLIITDIDGVWTDGGMFYLDNGMEAKKFNTSDSVGLLLAKEAGIDIMVLSGEDVPCVRNRMKKLKIDNCFLGIKDKLSLLTKIMNEKNLEFDQIAFIGDEINDFKLLRKVGFSACPQSAPWYTREIVNYVVPTNGGMGAFRDFVIEVLKRQGSFINIFNKIANK